jgi:adenosylcobyric acid synthase
MLGREVRDEQGLESLPGITPGLGLLPVETLFAPAKQTVLSAGATADGLRVQGYEIHMGQTRYLSGAVRLLTLSDGRADGAVSGQVWGTYLHGIFENGAFRKRWLDLLLERKGLPPLPSDGASADPREGALDRLAAHVRSHVDLDRLRAILEVGR